MKVSDSRDLIVGQSKYMLYVCMYAYIKSENYLIMGNGKIVILSSKGSKSLCYDHHKTFSIGHLF